MPRVPSTPRKVKIAAAILALLLAGCQSAVQPEPVSSRDSMVSGQIQITDRTPSSSQAPVLPEKPAISEENPLPPSSSASSSEGTSSAPGAAPSSSTAAEAPPASSAAEPESTEAPTASSTPEVPPASEPAPTEAPSQSPAPEPVSSAAPVSSSAPAVPVTRQPASSSNEVRAIWVSYLELGPMLQGKTQSQFTASVQEMFDRCAAYGLNTAFVQVRPFGDALYPSEYFPWSYLATGTEGVSPGFDPLAILVREGHARGLKIEAWINPYRVRHDVKYPLCSDNQAKIWLDEGSDHAASNGSGNIVFNPASEKAQTLIVNGIREIIRNYDVDGIHIDDYFYPSTGTAFDQNFDQNSYRRYQAAGGNLSHGDWRRLNVDIMIRKIYAAVKEENPRVVFGISPQSSISNNYNSMFFDVKKAVTNPGYCDYVSPQIYFGFQNEAQPYASTLAQWDAMITAPGVQLYPGLAVYKAGLVDNWAGSGKAEWQNSSDLLARQVLAARSTTRYGGFALYRYDSLFRPAAGVKSHIEKEFGHLQDILS